MENLNELAFFENTSIKPIDGEIIVTESQIQELYGVAKSTLNDNINKLKIDGIIENPKYRNVLNNRQIQVYSLEDIIAIGLRLRSERAIKFQKWAISILKDELMKAKKEIRSAQLMESIAWNHLEAKENHRQTIY